MSSQPLISVIIPVYNVELYIQTCMKSVLRQTYTNLEIILVDDGSTDKSGLICDKYKKEDKRIKVIHKKNGGLSDARNIGIDLSSGEYITFIDSDDAVDPDYIEYLYKIITEKCCQISLCSFQLEFENKKKRYLMGNGKEELLSTRECLEKILYHDQISVSACGKLYRRDLFNKIRYPKGKLFEDVGTTYKLILMAPFISCGYKCKYHYFIRGNSITTGSFTPRKLDLLQQADQMAEDIVQQFPELYEASLRYKVWARFSTLNQMINVSPEFVLKRAEIIDYIKKCRKYVLRNPKTPKRDKWGLIFLGLGWNVYKIAWKIYCAIKK